MNDRWIEVLREACERTSQKKVCGRLKQSGEYPSATLVNQVLNNKYPSGISRLKALVEGVYMHKTVICPVSDEISTATCDENQSRLFINTNPIRVRLYKACRSGCKHSRLEIDE